MNTQKVKRKLAAIFSADVQGYSRLMADNEVETVKSIKACREILFAGIGRHRGRVVDSPGDNVLSEFSSVIDAVACAVESQKALAAYNKDLPADRRMEFRVGVNLGDVIEDGDQIYGDGINIAARLEGLAPGGGICLSGSAYDQVKNKLGLGYEFLGNKSLKNISEPVPVYAVVDDPASAGTLSYSDVSDDPRFRRSKRWVLGVLAVVLVVGGFLFRAYGPDLPGDPPTFVKKHMMHLKIPDKPSIAVLPFTNMSGDQEQEYFSDGLTEDLITDLSKVSGMFVIARNSVFFYKGRAVKVSEVGRELGVKYVLEGSVRKAGNRVRITAQLIDARTEGHIWAERYDRDMADIFSVQDEVREKIVTALAVRMTTDDRKRMLRDTENVEAYELYLKGNNLCKSTDFDKLDNGRELLRQAIRLDPKFAKAYAAMGKTYFSQWIFGPVKERATLDKVYEWGTRAKEVNPNEPAGYSEVALYYLWTKQHDAAITEIRTAIALDPGGAELIHLLGDILAYAGQPAEGIEYMVKAMRLDPKHPVWYIYNLGHAYFLVEDYDNAMATFNLAVEQDPSFWPSFLLLAACYDARGNKEDSRAAMKQALAINPNIGRENWEHRIPYKDPVQAEKVISAFRKLGLYN